MSVIRKAAFVLCLLVYLIACPLTILYALGYELRPGAAQGIRKTGAIHVSTLPPDAAVYLEHRRYTKRTPTVLQGLEPGEYHLRLVAQGYEPWVGTVAVEAEKASSVEKILLVPKRPTRAELLPEAFEELLPLPETPFLLLANGTKLRDLVVYDTENKEHWPLASVELPLGNDPSARPSTSVSKDDPALVLATVRGSRFVMLRVRSRDGERFMGLELKPGDSRLTDLTTLFPARPVWIGWDPHAATYLFTAQDGAVNALDLDAMAIYPKVAERARGYGVVNGVLVVLTEDAAIERIDHEGKRTEILSGAPALGRALFGAKGLFRITGLPNALLLFLGERGELLMSRGPTRLVESGVRGFEFDPHSGRLLVWRRDRLGIADMSDASMTDDGAAPGSSLRWVFREGRDLEQAFWVYQGSHILFRDRDAVMLCEFGPHGPPTLRRLLQVKPGSAVSYVEATGQLYYLDRETGKLSSLEVLPRKERRFLPSRE